MLSRSIGAAVALLLLTTPPLAEPLPAGFTYLSDIEPAIAQDIRYFTTNNFLGRRVTGYDAPECVLTKAAAKALARAHASLAAHGFGLKVYDCYRPARAVADFVAWSKAPNQNGGTAYFHPTLPKSNLFSLGYIATRSNHTAGSTVDVGLVRIPEAKEDSQPSNGASDPPSRKTDDSPETCLKAPAQGEVDMGSDFDCFHPQSHFSAGGIGTDARSNRTLLKRAMTAAGFVAYDKEWWHFRLKDEPFPNRAFDFPISRKPEPTPIR